MSIPIENHIKLNPININYQNKKDLSSKHPELSNPVKYKSLQETQLEPYYQTGMYPFIQPRIQPSPLLDKINKLPEVDLLKTKSPTNETPPIPIQETWETWATWTDWTTWTTWVTWNTL